MVMNWAKNLRMPMLPRKRGRSGPRIWATPDDIGRSRNSTGDGKDRAIDYSDALSEVHLSSVIMGCVEWIATMLPRCPWMLERQVSGAWEPVDTHPVLDLLDMPTPWHSGEEMLASLLIDWNLGGTAYLQRVGTTNTGPPRELWYTPAGMVRPRWSNRLEGYNYKAIDGDWEEFDDKSFVQFRRRQNPGNPFMGVSPLEALGPRGVDGARGPSA